jgi:hypothetical protein
VNKAHGLAGVAAAALAVRGRLPMRDAIAAVPTDLLSPLGPYFTAPLALRAGSPSRARVPTPSGRRVTVTMEFLDEMAIRTGHQTIRPELQWLSRRGQRETHERSSTTRCSTCSR